MGFVVTKGCIFAAGLAVFYNMGAVMPWDYSHMEQGEMCQIALRM